MKTVDFERYLKNEKNYSEHTIEAYMTDILAFESFVAKTFETDDETKISTQMVRDWIMNLSENGITARSICRKIASLRKYFLYLEQKEVITINPMLKILPPKISKRNPVYIQKEDINHILTSPIADDNAFLQLRDLIILELFYATGIRQSEMLKIKERDIDFDNAYVKIWGKRSKERIIPLHKDLLNLLQQYISQRKAQNVDCEPLFVDKKLNPLTKDKLYNLIKRLLYVSNVEKKSPHVLRHTFATHLLNEGADINSIKELLGHSSLNATQVYTHNSIEDLKKAYKQAHPHADE
ncbi:MAG: tyrosine-type recombinase/integrase [Bacteroidales bacterium]|jgi:integrase/recombinase XerC|nr:tyrosine-type recombinase/integrase [Bacteroidales bacterium]